MRDLLRETWNRTMHSLQGHLLVASRDLVDPNFLRAAVLMVQHNDQGALGLILNRPTTTTIRDAVRHVSDAKCVRGDDLLFLGGPCQGSLMAVHGHSLLKEIEVIPDVYFSAETQNLERLMALQDDGPVRFFVGFAGWDAGQLEAELKSGSWRTAVATEDHIFRSEKDLWEELMRHLAGNDLLSTLNIKHVPSDPSLN